MKIMRTQLILRGVVMMELAQLTLRGFIPGLEILRCCGGMGTLCDGGGGSALVQHQTGKCHRVKEAAPRS